MIALLMLVTYALNNLFQAIAGWLMAAVSQRALKDMRRDLFTHLQRLPISFFDRQPAGELMSRMTNDIDVINQAVSQNVTALLASVLTLVGILDRDVFVGCLAGTRFSPGRAHHVRVHQLRRALYAPRLPRLAEESGRDERRDGRSHQRPESGQGVPPQRIGGGRVPRAQSGGVQSGRVCQQLRAAVDAADERAGKFLRDRAGGIGRLAGAARPGHRGHHRDVHHLRAELHPAAAPVGEHLQHHPGGAGRSRARVRDHRYAGRSGRSAEYSGADTPAQQHAKRCTAM